MNENEMMQDDEISLFDLWDKLREGWRKVVGCTVLGVVGAVAAIILIEPTYEATTVFQVARIGGTDVEPPSSVVERFKLPAFLQIAVQNTGDETMLASLRKSSSAVAKVGNAQLVKGTALVQLSTKGSSPEIAGKLGEAVLELFVARHDLLSAPLRQKIISDIALTKEKLAVVERELSELSKVMTTGGSVKDAQFAPVSLLASQRIQKQTELFNLRQQLTALELSLLPPATQPTRALEATYVPEQPVSPKKTLLFVLGMIGGLLVGVVWVLVSGAWRQARERRSLSGLTDN